MKQTQTWTMQRNSNAYTYEMEPHFLEEFMYYVNCFRRAGNRFFEVMLNLDYLN